MASATQIDRQRVFEIHGGMAADEERCFQERSFLFVEWRAIIPRH